MGVDFRLGIDVLPGTGARKLGGEGGPDCEGVRLFDDKIEIGSDSLIRSEA